LTILVPISMFGWIPMVVLLFWALPPRRAVLAAFLITWLFLPERIGYKIPALPAYTKFTAATLGTLVGILLFDAKRLATFRPQWIDFPIVLWCVAKLGSSISNGHGVYDGLSSLEHFLLTWGLPWLYGRLYFGDAAGIQELAKGLVIGGLIYVPLCLFEIKMSPQINMFTYGLYQHDFDQTKRFGGWRPTVFMQHGLAVGMWMCMSGLTAWWLWLTGSISRIGRIRMSWAAPSILVTAVLCKSFGAIALLVTGMGALWIARKTRRSWTLWVIWAFVPLYMALRLSGVWSGAGLVEWSASIGNAERADSLRSRLYSENQFIHAAWQRPWLGYRGWYNTDAQDAIPDALWMIELTAGGILGLGGVTLYWLWPAARCWRQMSQKDWNNGTVHSMIVLGVVISLSMIDNLFNAMLNPLFMLAAGALGGCNILAEEKVKVGRRFRSFGFDRI
jgi:hypothetical protein